MVLSQRSRLFIRGSFYFLYWWVIPVRVHLSDCDTDASLSQCVMFYNRFVKWMQAGDGTNNDALCLPATCYINVLLITVCMNQAQRVLMILCSALVLTVPFGRLDWECFHYGCQTNFKWTETLQNVIKWKKNMLLLFMEYFSKSWQLMIHVIVHHLVKLAVNYFSS